MNTAHKQAQFGYDDDEIELMKFAYGFVSPEDFFESPEGKPCRNCGEIWPHSPDICKN